MDIKEINQVARQFGLVGRSSAFFNVIDRAVRVAPTDLSVFIVGDSGTGKESIARIIHAYSKRSGQKYIAVNCGTLSEDMANSELFGHERGSFTGAVETRKGYFEEVDGGTIFLDEIGDLSLSSQVRLLRILENGEFLRVGSTDVRHVNVRVIAATNKNVEEMIKNGKFRDDLYQRLNQFPIKMPSLSQREDDIIDLFISLAADYASRNRMPGVELAPDAYDFLRRVRLRGNIRELKNIVEQIVALEPERRVTAEILKGYFPNSSYNTSVINSSDFLGGEKSIDPKLIYSILAGLHADIRNINSKLDLLLSSKGQTVDSSFVSNDIKILSAGEHLDETVEEAEEVHISSTKEESEKDLVIETLRRCNLNRRQAAKELNMSERTLYRKLLKYNIDL
ncbi:MAG: sigma-54-dependent Fis family transcriptional regulator [Alistipes sp.]|nr:sigma-54-dependent Fis family transcriptional regulator [Candidatus Alistipes equi]